MSDAACIIAIGFHPHSCEGGTNRASIWSVPRWPTGLAARPSICVPVHERLLEKLKASPKLFADESTAPALDPGRGTDQDRTALGLRSRRPAMTGQRSAGCGLCLCAGPQRRATDCASRRLQRNPAGRRLWRLPRARREVRRHARLLLCTRARRFYEFAAAGPAPVASEVLRSIAKLYRVEDDIRCRTAAARRAVRNQWSRANPICA